MSENAPPRRDESERRDEMESTDDEDLMTKLKRKYRDIVN